MNVIVVDYDPLWPQLFEEEAARIEQVLGGNLAAIHHIGSTAVEGLPAKPIIDVMPVVYDLAAVDARVRAFERLGYEAMGEYGIPGRRYYRKGARLRTHHVHVFEESAVHDIERHLAVRDYLRTHADAAAAYAELKRALAQRFSQDIEAYCDGKDAFVKALEAAALAWANRELAGG